MKKGQDATAARNRDRNRPHGVFRAIRYLSAWMDGPRIKRQPAEEGISYEEARERFRQEDE